MTEDARLVHRISRSGLTICKVEAIGDELLFGILTPLGVAELKLPKDEALELAGRIRETFETDRFPRLHAPIAVGKDLKRDQR